jgi:hypothetical protein
MSLPGSTALQVMFAVAIVIFTAYAAGRVHQWYRHGFEREEAFREGYNQASHALFHLATRNIAGKAPSTDGRAERPRDGIHAVPPSRPRHGRETDPTRLDTAGAA